MEELSYAQIIANEEHYLAIGQKTVYTRSSEGVDYSEATDIEVGGMYRMSVPTGCSVVFSRPSGLTIKHNVDFENRKESGSGSLNFDRTMLRELASKLPKNVAAILAAEFSEKVVPEVQKLARQIQESYNRQQDTLDAVRGVVADMEAIA